MELPISFVLIRWHDAGTYDATSKTGGPNGSIRNEEEFAHGANNGLKIALDFCGEFTYLFVCITVFTSRIGLILLLTIAI